jgi:hypothetical protein
LKFLDSALTRHLLFESDYFTQEANLLAVGVCSLSVRSMGEFLVREVILYKTQDEAYVAMIV